MKKGLIRKFTAILVVIAIVLSTGCSGASYSMTGSSNKLTIKATAEDGKYAEGFVMDISKKESVVIESELEEGELQIDFMEVINTASGDETDNYEAISTIKTVTVKPGDHLEFTLDYYGEFMPTLTAIGKTTGTVTISLVKQ